MLDTSVLQSRDNDRAQASEREVCAVQLQLELCAEQAQINLMQSLNNAEVVSSKKRLVDFLGQ